MLREEEDRVALEMMENCECTHCLFAKREGEEKIRAARALIEEAMHPMLNIRAVEAIEATLELKRGGLSKEQLEGAIQGIELMRVANRAAGVPDGLAKEEEIAIAAVRCWLRKVGEEPGLLAAQLEVGKDKEAHIRDAIRRLANDMRMSALVIGPGGAEIISGDGDKSEGEDEWNLEPKGGVH